VDDTNDKAKPHLTIVHSADRQPLTFDITTIGTDLIDEVELAKRLGVSRSTLQSWRYAGRGPRYIKLGRLVRYRSADVEAYLRAQTRGRAP
jgi:excisionase family DNA binding protein